MGANWWLASWTVSQWWYSNWWAGLAVVVVGSNFWSDEAWFQGLLRRRILTPAEAARVRADRDPNVLAWLLIMAMVDDEEDD